MRVHYQYKDDDDSFSLNNWKLGIMPVGRYGGFDFGATPTANIPFSGGLVLGHHTTGYNYPNLAAPPTTSSNKFGTLRLLQGGILDEDRTLNQTLYHTAFTIAANSSGNPRRDLIYVTHWHVQSTGGMAPIYGKVQGTPAANPVTPSVPNPLTDTAIGYLEVPDGGGVGGGALIDSSWWHPNRVPNFGNDSTIPHTDLSNNFTVYQNIEGIAQGYGSLIYGSNVLAIQPNDTGKNYFLYAPALPVSTYQRVNEITNYAVLGQKLTVMVQQNVFLANFNNGGKFITSDNKDIYVKASEVFECFPIDLGGTVYLFVLNAPYWRNTTNKFRATQSWGNATAALDVLGGLSYTPNGNTFVVRPSANEFCNYIQSIDYTINAPERGTIIVLDWLNTNAPTNNRATFRDESTLAGLGITVPTGYKPIRCPNGETFQIGGTAAQKIMLLETQSSWEVISVTTNGGFWHPVTLAANLTTNASGVQQAAFEQVGSLIVARGIITTTVGFSQATGVNFSLGTIPGLPASAYAQYPTQLWQNGTTPRPCELIVTGGTLQCNIKTGATLNGAGHQIFLHGFNFSFLHLT